MITVNSTGCGYSRSGSWIGGKDKNPLYIGTNSSGSYVYVGQIIFPRIENASSIIKIELSLYRTRDAAVYSRAEYYGTSEDQADYGSVLSTGEKVEFTGGEGWKTVDVSGIIDAVKGYTGEWALLLGNPNTKSTYIAASGYGSGKEPYLTVYYDEGTRLAHYKTGVWVACKVYRATSETELKQCNVYRATDEITLEKL